MTLVSAHRCLTHAAIEAAIALGADYVEFDVQRIADGSLVLLHDLVDDPPAGTLRYDEALALLAGRARAHLDLKLRGGEIPIVTEAIARLGTDRLLVTTHHDEAVRALRAWADREGHDRFLAVARDPGPRLRAVPGSPVPGRRRERRGRPPLAGPAPG
ncbi:MAG: glycerophosphodiester phosphodiesterase [Nocardioides sp.]|nr:glycerophosphodiester phosphodiesterase [Nocardioides sp.]